MKNLKFKKINALISKKLNNKQLTRIKGSAQGQHGEPIDGDL